MVAHDHCWGGYLSVHHVDTMHFVTIHSITIHCKHQQTETVCVCPTQPTTTSPNNIPHQQHTTTTHRWCYQFSTQCCCHCRSKSSGCCACPTTTTATAPPSHTNQWWWQWAEQCCSASPACTTATSTATATISIPQSSCNPPIQPTIGPHPTSCCTASCARCQLQGQVGGDGCWIGTKQHFD